MFADLRTRLRALFRRDAVEVELDDELRFHFEKQVEKYVTSGLPRAEAMDRRRSITLHHYAPLASITGLCLISLQKGEPAAQTRNPPEGMLLHDLTAELHDYADTAAVVDNLDLVITANNAPTPADGRVEMIVKGWIKLS